MTLIKITEQQLAALYALEEAKKFGKKTPSKISKDDTYKAHRKASRDSELENSGGWTAKHKVHKGKKDQQDRQSGRKAKHKGKDYVQEGAEEINREFDRKMKSVKTFPMVRNKLNEQELWEEFINELYGVKESAGGKYDKFIKILEAEDIINNRRINKSKFSGDKEFVRGVFERTLAHLQETGDVYETMKYMLEEMNTDDIISALKKQVTTRVAPKPSDEEMAAFKKEKAGSHMEKGLGAIKSKKSVHEYDNYAPGTANDSRAPWNQSSQSTGGNPTKGEFKVLWYDDFVALLNGEGKLWALNLEAINRDEFAEYADREYDTEPDGEGGVDYNYSDEWELDGDTIESFVNDTISYIKKGHGEADWEQGAEMLVVDDELRENLLGLAKYIKNENWRQKFIDILGQMAEMTSATSSGAFVGPFDTGALDYKQRDRRTPSDEIDSLVDEDNVNELSPATMASAAHKAKAQGRNYQNYNLARGLRKYFQKLLPFENVFVGVDYFPDENGNEWTSIDVSWVGDDDRRSKHQFTYQYNSDGQEWLNVGAPVDKMVIPRKASTGIVKAIKAMNPKTKYLHPNDLSKDKIFTSGMHRGPVGETTTTTNTGNYQYDTPGFDTRDKSFWYPDGRSREGNAVVKKSQNESKKSVSEDAFKDTQYPDGGFVELDNCTKLNNNKAAQNGGCSQGAVDNVVKVKKSKNSVVSK